MKIGLKGLQVSYHSSCSPKVREKRLRNAKRGEPLNICGEPVLENVKKGRHQQCGRKLQLVLYESNNSFDADKPD